jgi:ActR/RegA family two-component response regulator
MARTSAALLVDSDLKGLESLVYGFQGVDWRSTACPAPETALFLVKASAADILVVAAREPHEKTLTLLRQLRSNEETRTLPLLVMGPASLRPSVIDCGSIDFLPTPVFVRDVITASRILVSLATQRAHEHGREPRIDGSLADFGFFSIIRVMSGLLRSGVLQVNRGNRRGEILFSEGEIAGAQVGSLQGQPAIHQLLLWEDAKIELRLRAVARRTQFNRRFDEIMDEAERFVRDYAHAIQGIGPSSSVYEKNEAGLTSTAGSVPSDVTPVLRLFDGRRTLTDIIDDSPFRVFDTVRILTRLVDVGVLTRRKPLDKTSTPTAPLQRFWETARIVSPPDSVAPAPSPKPASERIGRIDSRIGEPNRREGQRRAPADTPVRGTPMVGTVATRTPASGAPETASVAAPVVQATDASKARASGTIDLRAAGDRRQAKTDRRTRPSVTIDVGLVEAATSPTPAAPQVETSATPAQSSTRAGRVTGTMQVALSSGHRGSAAIPQTAGGGVSVEIDPGLASEAGLGAKQEAPVASLPQSPAPAADPAPAKAGASRTGANPVPVAPHKAAAPSVAGRAPASSHDSEAPAAGGSASAAATRGDGPRTARVTGTLSIAPSQRSAVAKTTGKGASVQLDPVLMAELGRLEKATTPVGLPESEQPLRATPAPVAPFAQPSAASAAPSAAGGPTPSPTKAGHAGRVTGTLSVSPSSRLSANTLRTPASGLSVSLDPALMAEAQELDVPKPRPTPALGHRLAGTAAPRTAAQDVAPPAKGQARAASSEAPAPAAARPTPPSSDDSVTSQPGKQTGRISGAFNAVERDFFAREADLYKREAEDNFADLDEPGRQGDGKTSHGRGPSKRQS